MALPARMAVLNHLSQAGESSIQETMDALEPIYGQENQFNYPLFMDHLMALEANGLATMAKYELDENDELILFFDITEDGINVVNKYVPKNYKQS